MPVSHGQHLDYGRKFPIDHRKRKSPEHESSCSMGTSGSALGEFGNFGNRAAKFAGKAGSYRRAPFKVPLEGGLKFETCRLVELNVLTCHAGVATKSFLELLPMEPSLLSRSPGR